MKTKLLKLTLFVATLFFIGCQSSDDDMETQNIKESELDQYELMNQAYQYMMNNAKGINDGTLRKNNNNENGVQWVLQYTGSPLIPNGDYNVVVSGTIRIPNTDMVMYINYPGTGQDVAKLQGEWMMTNWNGKQPRVFIVDFSDGLVKYSNWCDEVRTGKTYQTSRVKYFEIDATGDGVTDFYRFDNTAIDSNFRGGGNTTLTDAQNSEPFAFPIQGDCREPTERIDFSWKLHIVNGVWEVDMVLDGVKYSYTKKLKNQS